MYFGIKKIMQPLQERRPIFVSEADFQLKGSYFWIAKLLMESLKF